MGKQWKQCQTLFFGGSKITADGDHSHEIKRHLLLGRKIMTNLDSILKSRDKGPSSQGYGFSCGHVWLWELDCEEGWVPKNWCFWTVVLEKTLESPLDCKEIQPNLYLMSNMVSLQYTFLKTLITLMFPVLEPGCGWILSLTTLHDGYWQSL